MPANDLRTERVAVMDVEYLCALGREVGFSLVAPLAAETLKPQQAVRDMCRSNTCGRFDTCWSCPPGCGTLEECTERIRRYTRGIIVQTIGALEDPYDGEGMIEAERAHKKAFSAMRLRLEEKYPDMLALGAGCCTVCAQCTYPQEPCRNPAASFSSMEAYGLLVLEVCRANQVAYYYGTEKIAYTGCFLLE